MDVTATLIMTTVDSEEAAELIATKLVERREAACVQQIDIRSRYRWQGELKCDAEVLLLAKTSTIAASAAIKTIEESHSYEVPEIVAIPITDGLPAYLEWIANETSRNA